MGFCAGNMRGLEFNPYSGVGRWGIWFRRFHLRLFMFNPLSGVGWWGVKQAGLLGPAQLAGRTVGSAASAERGVLKRNQLMHISIHDLTINQWKYIE